MKLIYVQCTPDWKITGHQLVFLDVRTLDFFIRSLWWIQGGARDATPLVQLSSFSSSFREEVSQIIGWRPHLRGSPPPDPANPGSATIIWFGKSYWSIPRYLYLLCEKTDKILRKQKKTHFTVKIRKEHQYCSVWITNDLTQFDKAGTTVDAIWLVLTSLGIIRLLI